VPGLNPSVGFQGEGFLGNILREALASVGIPDVEVVDRVLDERHMLLGAQQDLDRLPPGEAHRRERRYRWRLVYVVGRLERVLAAYRCEDPGNGGVRYIHEEGYPSTARLAQCSSCIVGHM
jgi:hypothetical protein